MSKLLSIYSEELLRWKLLSEKVLGSKCFFGLWLKHFRKFCQNCFLIFQGKILGEILFWRKLQSHNFFLSSGGKFSAGSSKLLSIFSKEHLLRTYLFEKNYRFIVFLRASGKKISTSLAILRSFVPEERSSTKLSVWRKYRFRNIFDVRVKFFQQKCQNQILHFQWNILGKIFSLKKLVNSQSFFERRVKNLRQVCKNWIFIIRGTFLKKCFFETHYGSIDFVRASGGNFSAGLSKLQFTFLRATLWERGRKFLFEKNPFNIEFLRTSGEKFSGKAVKFHSNFQEEQFARKLFVRK